MPKIALTDLSVRALKPPETGQVIYWDKTLAGFGIRVSQGGARTWLLIDPRSKRREKETIGRYPVLSLAEARQEAKKRLASITLGQRAKPSSLPFQDALAAFLVAHKGRARTKADLKRFLEKYYSPTFREKYLTEITSQDVTRILDKLQATPSEQNHAFAAIRTFFNWAERREYVERSPIAKLKMPAATESRTRVLTPIELKAVWSAAGDTTFGKIVKLLILTGQRKGEVSALKLAYFDRVEKTITLPASLTKNRREHVFPYGEMAAEILRTIPDNYEYLFPAAYIRSERTTVFNGWSKPKVELDTASGVTDWTLHDLRRTFASGLASQGVSLPTIERLLNHVSGSFGGIVSVYQRYNWLPEARLAVDKWEQYLSTLLTATVPPVQD